MVMYEVCDTDGDGLTLDETEFNPSEACKKFLDDLAKFGNDSTQEEKISLFHSQDANGDGKVTFFEYVNAFISEVGCKASYEK